MALIVAGLNHLTAPIEVREKLTFRPQDAVQELARLREQRLIREGVILSTCNRTEIYAVEERNDTLSDIASLLSTRLGADAAPFDSVPGSGFDTDPAAAAIVPETGVTHAAETTCGRCHNLNTWSAALTAGGGPAFGRESVCR